jgi:CheY-like chemotaxis protein
VSLVSAASGKGGLQLAQDCHPDLILLDMHLPDIPGNEVLTQLRAGEDTRQIPVVIISADATAARARQLKEAGASQYLTKPFQVSQFLRVLDDHLTAR